MDQLFKNKTLPVILSVSVILLAALYWFFWRPDQIRKHCSKSAKAAATKMELTKNDDGQYQIKKSANGTIDKIRYDEEYKICLRDNGIE